MSLNHNQDCHYMNHALNLARRGQGCTGINPSVGCVLVKNDRVIAAAHTAQGGRPHAETIALSQTDDAKGATAYVTLEPCAHEGETPACARELVSAGVARVVIGYVDPDPRTSGQGIQILRDAGVDVDVLDMPEYKNPHQGFFKRIKQNRPFVTVKIAISLDGKIALANGESKWITGDPARRYGHVERLKHDAILTGAGTVRADNPSFTVRLGGEEIVKPVYVLGNDEGSKASRSFALVGGGNLKEILQSIANDGINTLYVEGGAKVTTSFIKSGLVDRLLVFQAPKIIGADGLSAFGDLDFYEMCDIYNFKQTTTRALGADTLSEYTCSQD